MKYSRRKDGSGRGLGHLGKAADNSAEFHGLFSAQFLQRYAELFEALAQPVQHVALLNSLTDVNDCDEMGLESFYRHGTISCLRHPQPPDSYPPPPDCPYTQLRQFYWMDFASVLPPLLLAPQPHHAVLEMCAAPGGMSLVLAQQLLKGVPAQQPQQSSAGAVGLSTGLLEQLALQEQQQQQPLQDQDHEQPEQQPELEQERLAEAPQLDSVQQPTEVHVAGSSTSEQQQQQQQAPAADAEDRPSSSDAGSDGEDDAATGSTPSSAGYASGAQQPGRLVCNEMDPNRRQRLSAVLAAYLPGSLRRRVRCTGQDAAKHWATFEAGMYDRVLLDAPCSSERHVVQQAVQAGGVVPASSWSKERCQQLAAQQLKMLLGGLRALKPGGRLVYCTSSFAEVENDAVVHKALQQQQQQQQQQQGGEVRVVAVDEWGLEGVEELSGGQRTKYGLLCLPDKQGWGPLYVALLEKTSG